MEETRKQLTRKHGPQLCVHVLPDEKTAIQQQAALAGLSVAAYLRNVALGYEITSVLDYQHVNDLVRVNGDLGRLGGLLKLWLTNDERIKQFRPLKMRAMILELLAKIERNQDELHSIIRKALAS